MDATGVDGRLQPMAVGVGAVRESPIGQQEE
jgi:hypothetical protein